MTKETLIELGLNEDQVQRVLELLGDFVPKQQLDAVSAELRAANAALTDREGQIETLQAEQSTKDAQFTEAMTALKFDNAVEQALIAAGAKNTKAVRALLSLDGAQLDVDGTVQGLEAQIRALVEAPDSGFLFDSDKPTFRGLEPPQRRRSAGDSMTLEKLRKLSATERLDFALEHPETYKKLYNGG